MSPKPESEFRRSPKLVFSSLSPRQMISGLGGFSMTTTPHPNLGSQGSRTRLKNADSLNQVPTSKNILKALFYSLGILPRFRLISRGPVAQLVERPSKSRGSRCNSTDAGSNRPTLRHKLIGEILAAPSLADIRYKSAVWEDVVKKGFD